MITLSLRFPAGRYHATPWGHQVNEGLVEWPPSPWRLLRALLSVGHTRLGWQGVVPEVAAGLIRRLAAVLPAYTLPAAPVAHSRHYMPIGVLDKGKDKTTLVLDTWANASEPLLVHWPVDLPSEERDLLAGLISSMNYLGRSESWVEGRLLSESTMLPNCGPHADSGRPLNGDGELVKLMAPIPAPEYDLWRAAERPPAPSDGKKRRGAKKPTKKDSAFPPDLLEAMQWDTSKWKKHGWSQPPGSRMIQYRRPRGVHDAPSVPAGACVDSAPLADLVLLALATLSRNNSALPTVARTLPQAELLHKALIARASRGAIPHELSGCDDQGEPLKGHRHCHVLPLDLDRDGHLDHVVLWAPMGFGSDAMRAIREVRRTWTKGGVGELRVALAGHGWKAQLADRPENLDSYLGASRRWLNVTPFVPPRFIKKRGVNTPEGQVRAELTSRGLPEPTTIDVAAFPPSGALPDAQARHFRHYVRARRRSGLQPPQDVGWFVRLTFPSDVTGPICLGYGSHFGLGLFVPDERPDTP